MTNAGSINDNQVYVNGNHNDDGDGDDVQASRALMKEQGLRHLGKSSYLRR